MGTMGATHDIEISTERYLWFEGAGNLLGKPCWAEIDLDAIGYNCSQLKKWIGDNTELMIVVKGDGYSTGAIMVSETALENGATRLGVARVDEGVQLRRAGIGVPILVMTYVPAEEMGTVVKYKLTPPIMHLHTARALSEISAAQNVVTPVHVKVDTGMGRFGLLPDEVVDFVKRLVEFPSIRLEGLYTHFSAAGDIDPTYTYQQFHIFKKVLGDLQEVGISIPIRHVCNSPATLRFPEMHLDMVRCAAALYRYPSPVTGQSISLRPSLSVKSRVGRIRTLPAGSSISYHRLYTTTRPTEVALVLAGFGDGNVLGRQRSNQGTVLIRGKPAPILGRMCMDQCVVDVSHIPDVQQDDEVVILGSQDGAEIGVNEIRSVVGGFSGFLRARLPRVYLKGGKVVKVETLIGEAKLAEDGSVII